MGQTAKRFEKRRIAFNNAVLAGWVLAAVSLPLLVAMTMEHLRGDTELGVASPNKEFLFVGFLWLLGALGLGYLCFTPIVTLWVEGSQFHVRERWLLRSRETRFEVTDLSRPRIRRTLDSYGDDYFNIEVTLPDGRSIVVGGANGHALAQSMLSDMDLLIAGQ